MSHLGARGNEIGDGISAQSGRQRWCGANDEAGVFDKSDVESNPGIGGGKFDGGKLEFRRATSGAPRAGPADDEQERNPARSARCLWVAIKFRGIEPDDPVWKQAAGTDSR